MRTLLVTLSALLLAACGGDPDSSTQHGEDTPHFPGLDTASEIEGLDGYQPDLSDPDDADPKAPGTLRVTFGYDGAIPLQDVTLSLLTEAATCADFDPTVPIEENVLAQKTADSLDAVILFEGYPVETTYTLYATARGPGGKLAAKGCLDNLAVMSGDLGTTEVPLELHVLLLDARGEYSVTHVLALEDGSLDPVDYLIDQLAVLYDNPVAALHEKVKTIALANTLLAENSPAFIAFSSSLQNGVDAWFTSQTPTYVGDLIEKGAGLGPAVGAVTLTADLDLGGSEGDIQLSGTWAWKDLAVQWPGGCVSGSPGCETLHFAPTDLIASDFPVYLSTNLFSASVANFDNLILGNQTLSLSLGDLALHLLHEVLLPEVGGPTDILELVTGFADCATIVATMTPSSITGIGMDAATIEGMCQSAVNSLVGDLEDAIEDLQIESELKVNGTCTLVDEDEDLEVDALVSGVWDGDVVMDGQEAAIIQGTFQSN